MIANIAHRVPTPINKQRVVELRAVVRGLQQISVEPLGFSVPSIASNRGAEHSIQVRVRVHRSRASGGVGDQMAIYWGTELPNEVHSRSKEEGGLCVGCACVREWVGLCVGGMSAYRPRLGILRAAT